MCLSQNLGATEQSGLRNGFCGKKIKLLLKMVGLTVEQASKFTLTKLNKVPGVNVGGTFVHLELTEPSADVKEIARRELRETPDVVQTAVRELKQLLQDDKELNVPFHNEAWLVKFLRPCKYYPQSAYKLIKRYFSFKVKHSKLFDGLLPSKEQNIFDNDVITMLPNRDQLGRRIVLLTMGKKWNHNKCTLDEVFKAWVLLLEAAMLEPETQTCGAVIMFDMDGLSMKQVLQYTPPFAKRVLDLLQESFPGRIKGLYIINQPYIFNMIFQIFKPFLTEKFKSRLIFMGIDRDLLYKNISPKCLPEAYGGTNTQPRISGPQWFELLSTIEQEYEEINSYGLKK